MMTLGGWGDFYVIVGSSAGALIGLQFVVMTLLADMPARRANADAGAAFASPSVVHLAVVLLLSAMLSAPWHRMSTVGALWGVVGLGGLVYSVIVARRMRAQSAYEPVLEDWLAHVLLPFLAYAVLAASAFAAGSTARSALFFVGGAALLLLFVSIHNAWDSVMHNVFVRRQERGETEPPR